MLAASIAASAVVCWDLRRWWYFADCLLDTSKFDIHCFLLRLLQGELLGEGVNQGEGLVGSGDYLDVKIAQGLVNGLLGKFVF